MAHPGKELTLGPIGRFGFFHSNNKFSLKPLFLCYIYRNDVDYLFVKNRSKS